ncbi:MAG: hypothetical protein ACI9RG_000264 [Sulfurimonas sp.]|jgi:hypothetical protein
MNPLLFIIKIILYYFSLIYTIHIHINAKLTSVYQNVLEDLMLNVGQFMNQEHILSYMKILNQKHIKNSSTNYRYKIIIKL